MLPKIERPPSLALMAQIATAVLGIGVIGAAGYGFGISSAATPQSCTVALNTASRIFIAQTNLVSAVNVRATRGQDEFAEHDADVNRLLDELEDLSPAFDEAAAECREVAK